MGVEDCCQVPEDKRTTFIEQNVVGALPEDTNNDTKENVRERATKIAINYAGQDINALSILAYASEKGRFDEFAGELEDHYDRNLKYVHPEARKLESVPGARRAAGFFMNCYEELEIKPSNDSDENNAYQQEYDHARYNGMN